MPAAAIAALMDSDTLTVVEDLDHAARSNAGVDLLADQLVRHRVEEAVEFDMVVERHAGEAPFGELVVMSGNGAKAARSMVSNSCRRLTPSRRMT
jgi:hypothetical protein